MTNCDECLEPCLHYCCHCDEEYMLPEGTLRCPICGDYELEILE